MNPCIAIPIYNHPRTIGAVVESLESLQLPCLVVDDGSDATTRLELDKLKRRYAWVEVLHHDRNRGRGAALRTAYAHADGLGMTHVVQLDADGQHSAEDVPRLLAAARSEPDALVLGSPEFDESIPWHRLHGRKLSKAIVGLETRSRAADDPLCGFRCIPLAQTLPVLERARTGDRMDFDPELIIRLVRAGVTVVNVPTAVHYPEEGVSHFRMVKDNLRIAWVYIRLAADSAGRSAGASSWVSAPERGSRAALRFVMWLLKRTSARVLRLLLAPIAAYYTLFAPGARRASRAYLAQVRGAGGGSAAPPRLIDSYRHFHAFAEVILDRLQLWSGAFHEFEITLHGKQQIKHHAESGRGAFLLGAHLGNFDMLRVVAREAGIPVNILMFTSNAEKINDAIKDLDPDSMIRLIQTEPRSVRTAFEIRRCVGRGEFVAILADRAFPEEEHRSIPVTFFEKTALLPSGPFMISMVLHLPVILSIALRVGPKRYDVFFEELAPVDHVPARDRPAVAAARVQRYAARLEHYCREAPLQWFNFYDFWKRE